MPTLTIERPKTSTQFPQPDNCPVAFCSAIAMYEQELKRHRATESSLRASILRERQLLLEKDALILQKDTLAKESEHRLLNGLQLVASLLTLQSRAIQSPEEAGAQLTNAANRVGTLARIHRHLHTLDKVETVEFKHYLEKLCEELCDMACGDLAGNCLRVEGTELEIPRATAIPLGFIANELITNSIKYAKGKITVNLQTTPNGDCTLSVSDDGPGLPQAFDPAATRGLGMKIIATLVGQIHGELKFAKGDHGQGTRFSVLFNLQAPRS